MTTKEYLETHSLNPKFLKNVLGWDFTDKKITIPIYNINGKDPFNKYRHLQGDIKFTFDKGKHPTLYPLWLIKDKSTLVLCEGEPDAARLWQEGIPAITTVGGVSSFNKEMAAMLKGKEILLALDNDKEGQNNIPNYLKLLQEQDISTTILSLPSEYKDVSEYFTDAHNKKDFSSLLTFTENQWILNTFAGVYSIVDNKEFLSKEYPEKKWLIKPLMRATGVVFVVGEGGVGKTTLSYSMAKSISEGKDWLDRYETTQSKVLIIDKENEEIDRLENLLAQKVIHENIYHYTTPLTFNFINNEGELSDEALFVRAFVLENNISVVILDSLVDFYLGNENDSTDAANNILTWKKVFPDCAIIPIHHENKPQQGNKRSSIHRIRGSSHLFNAAQSVLSLSILDEEFPERIMVEHSKVRGARKQKPFTIEMIVEQNPKYPDNIDETVITGFKYDGEVELPKKKKQEARDAVLELLTNNPYKHYTAREIKNELPSISGRNVEIALPELRENKLVAFDMSKRLFTYWFLNTGNDDIYYEDNPNDAV